MTPFRPPLVIAVLALAGCSTPGFTELYAPLVPGATYGYSDKPIAEQRYEVTYVAPRQTAFTFEGPSGRQVSDAELARAYDFALLRAADIALANGAAAFRVVNRLNDVDVRNYWYYRDPYWPAYPGWYGGWRGHPYYWGYPWYGPYDDRYAVLATRVVLTVDLITVPAPDAFDARRIQSELRSRYAEPPT
jgi:hypothetical protein